jgi:hypothetical protein
MKTVEIKSMEKHKITSVNYSGRTYYSWERFCEDNKISKRTMYNWVKAGSVIEIDIAGATSFYSFKDEK